MPQPKPF